MITLNGSFSPIKIGRGIFLLESTWSAPEHLRPLTLFFVPFLEAKPKHVEKYLSLYAEFYQSRRPRPLHVYLAFPDLTSFAFMSITASSARKHLKNFRQNLDPADKILMHGMSMGCFTHATTLYYEDRGIHAGLYNSLKKDFKLKLKDRIVGQLYESPVYGGPARFGLDRMVEGATHGIGNPGLRRILQSSMRAFLSMSETRRELYDGFIDTFINDTPVVPTLALTSEEDPLCDVPLFEEKTIEIWQDRGRGRGVNVNYKCFPGNAHARCLQLYPDEYKRLLFDYLSDVQNVLEVYDELNRLRDGEEEEEEEGEGPEQELLKKMRD